MGKNRSTGQLGKDRTCCWISGERRRAPDSRRTFHSMALRRSSTIRASLFHLLQVFIHWVEQFKANLKEEKFAPFCDVDCDVTTPISPH